MGEREREYGRRMYPSLVCVCVCEREYGRRMYPSLVQIKQKNNNLVVGFEAMHHVSKS
jgi:hypothetical protein